MQDIQNSKIFNAIPPAVIRDDAAFASHVIDTADLSYVEFHIAIGSIDASPAVLKVMASTVKTDATTLGGTPVQIHDLATKPGATDDDAIIVIGVSLAKLPSTPRYLQLQVTAGNGAVGTYLSAIAVGHASGNVSSGAADRGALAAEYAS